MELKKNLYFLYFFQKFLPKFFLNYYLTEKKLNIFFEKNKIQILFKILNKSLFFNKKQLMDIFAVDFLGKYIQRFEINYCLLNIKLDFRILLKTFIFENENLTSLENLYKSSNWLEREIWDLFGIYFENHNDLRRLLTDYGFEGYPLRKDFPISGFVEVLYNTEYKKIMLKFLELNQEFRYFDFVSPWNNNNT